jgi:ubiquinone/menaquinone biosynthesis C-methylase UbiE
MSEQEWTEEMSRIYAAYMRRNIRFDHRQWAHRIAADASRAGSGVTIAEVAGGNGFLLFELAALFHEPRLLLTDSSRLMTELAHEEANARHLQVETRLCPAEKLDLPDTTTDLVVCKHAIRMLADVDAALREMRRILKPGGTAYLIDFSGDASWLRKRLLDTWIKLTAPAFLGHYFWKSINTGLRPSRLIEKLGQAGFSDSRMLAHGVSYLIRATK